MASSCGGGMFSNLCNVQPSSQSSSSMMSSGFRSQSHLVSPRRPLSRPSLQNRFLPRVPSSFSTQVAVKSGASRRVHHITASAKSRNDLVVCFGELLIDFVPTVGGLSLADAPAFKKAPGGAPANVACGIAKLGGNAAFIGKVGDDEFGYMLCDVLKDQKVETKGIRFDAHARTALAFVTLRDDGEREFMFYRNPSADMLFEIHELDTDLLKEASVFHYGSISLITEPSRSTHLEAMRIAKEAGSILSYDPNLRLPLWSSAAAAKEGIMSIWDQADIIKVSDEEVIFLTGGDPKDDAANMKMLHPGCKLMLVTEGGEGCRYYTPKFHGQVGGLKVQVVDTTGAGDAFCAGLLNQIALFPDIIENEAKLREALTFANACGAITTTERGAIPSLPDKETVSRLLSTAHRLSVKTNQRFIVKDGSFVARLSKMEIPELNYELKDCGDDSLNSRRLKNLVVEDASVIENYIARQLLTIGYVDFDVFFQFFLEIICLQGNQYFSEVASSFRSFLWDETVKLEQRRKNETGFRDLPSVLVCECSGGAPGMYFLCCSWDESCENFHISCTIMVRTLDVLVQFCSRV